MSSPETTPAWRRWLARKLDPDLCRRAERGHHLSGLVGEMYRWCGEFPDIDAAMGWIIGCQSAYWRKLGDPADPRACNISTFRERLRERAHVNQ